MKKNLLLLCVMSLCVSLVGCGEKDTLNRPSNAALSETTTETTETTAESTVPSETTTTKEQTTATSAASDTSTTTSVAATSVSIVTQIVQQVQEVAEQPADPIEMPTVSAEFYYIDSRDENGNYYDGVDYYADLNGNFDYCKILTKRFGKKTFESFPTPEATFSKGSSYLESGSEAFCDKVEVIPYFFDGTVGNKVTISNTNFVHRENPHSSDSWRALYAAQLNACYSSSDMMYTLFDVNSDGVPELFVSDSGYNSAECAIYAIINGACTDLGRLGDYGEVAVSPTSHVICYEYSFWDCYAGGALQFDGKTLSTVDSYEYPFDGGYGSYNGVEMLWSDVEYLVNTEYNTKYSDRVYVGRDNYFSSNMDATRLYY